MNKNHTTISIDEEKASDKIHHPFMIKTLSKVGILGTYLNKVMAIYDNPIDNIILNEQKLIVFPLLSERRKRCPYLQFLFSTVLNKNCKYILATAIRRKKASEFESRK